MSRYDENYEQVIWAVKKAGERGTTLHQLAQEFPQDGLTLLACIRRGIKNRSLSFKGEALVYNDKSSTTSSI